MKEALSFSETSVLTIPNGITSQKTPFSYQVDGRDCFLDGIAPRM
jgi:hypothetical protein